MFKISKKEFLSNLKILKEGFKEIPSEPKTSLLGIKVIDTKVEFRLVQALYITKVEYETNTLFSVNNSDYCILFKPLFDFINKECEEDLLIIDVKNNMLIINDKEFNVVVYGKGDKCKLPDLMFDFTEPYYQEIMNTCMFTKLSGIANRVKTSNNVICKEGSVQGCNDSFSFIVDTEYKDGHNSTGLNWAVPQECLKILAKFNTKEIAVIDKLYYTLFSVIKECHKENGAYDLNIMLYVIKSNNFYEEATIEVFDKSKIIDRKSLVNFLSSSEITSKNRLHMEFINDKLSVEINDEFEEGFSVKAPDFLFIVKKFWSKEVEVRLSENSIILIGGGLKVAFIGG